MAGKNEGNRDGGGFNEVHPLTVDRPGIKKYSSANGQAILSDRTILASEWPILHQEIKGNQGSISTQERLKI